MDAVIRSSHAVSFPAALIAAAGKTGNPAIPKNTQNGKNGKGRTKPIPFSGTKDSDAHRDLSERYASAMRRDYIGVIERLACAVSHGTIHPAVTVQSGGSPRRLSDGALDAVHAAGACRHWGVSLIRLKYGHDASEFRTCLAKFRELSDDDELTQFLAHDVLLGWLLDRRIRGRGEWATKCQNLRRKINSEALEAASLMAYKLGLRYDKGNKT